MFNDLIGKPWSSGGLGPHSYDCFGLLLEVGRRMGWPFKLCSPDLPEEVRRARAQLMIAAEFSKHFDEVKYPSKVGDVLFMSGTTEEPWHVAVVIEPARALHCIFEGGCVVSQVSYLMPRVFHTYRAAASE